MKTLDAGQIRQQLSEFPDCDVQVFKSLPSTNAWLLERVTDLPELAVCVADSQTSGRGRRGKSWQSPSAGVTFSVARRFHLPPTRLGGLSLATGCAVAEVLERHGVGGVSLKWPNDVLQQGKKLCGLLIELSTTGDTTNTVTGIGLNYHGAGDEHHIDQPFTDLGSAVDGVLPNRSHLIGELVASVLTAYQRYETLGLSGFQSQWRSYDALSGNTVCLHQANGEQTEGIARGIADTGALLIETQAGVEEHFAGEVSVRLRQ